MEETTSKVTGVRMTSNTRMTSGSVTYRPLGPRRSGMSAAVDIPAPVMIALVFTRSRGMLPALAVGRDSASRLNLYTFR